MKNTRALVIFLSTIILTSCSTAPSHGKLSPIQETTYTAEAAVLVPVAGISFYELTDSYTSPRSGGRVHHAIDIMAPAGTRVLAAADGRVVSLKPNSLGGIVIYQLGNDNETVYYYAHLDGYVPGLRVGQEVRKGQHIAFVGNTGNAVEPHLHFSISKVKDPARWWEGENVNPYPILTQSNPAIKD